MERRIRQLSSDIRRMSQVRVASAGRFCKPDLLVIYKTHVIEGGIDEEHHRKPEQQEIDESNSIHIASTYGQPVFSLRFRVYGLRQAMYKRKQSDSKIRITT